MLTCGTPPFPIAFFDDDLSVVNVPSRCFRKEYGKTPSEYLRP